MLRNLQSRSVRVEISCQSRLEFFIKFLNSADSEEKTAMGFISKGMHQEKDKIQKISYYCPKLNVRCKTFCSETNSIFPIP